MEDKVVLITGATLGIGRETAIHFARFGAKVVATGLGQEQMDEVVDLCKNVSPNKYEPLGIVGDLTDEEFVNRLVRSTIETFGKLDVLVNNAGSAAFTKIDDKQLMEKYDKVFNVNVKSVLLLCHLAVPYLEKTKGCIVNVSSTGSMSPMKNMTVYCMSKSALDMLTQCLALELGPKGVRVNSINPGYIKTSGADEKMGRGMGDAFEKMCIERYPLRRAGDSVDCARAIEFLASENASFITGELMKVDGGGVYVSHEI